jgi:AraC-like DNA-binding protein
VLIIGVKGTVPIADGEAEHRVDHDIGAGTVALLPAGRVHFGSDAIAAPAMYYWFHFSLPEPPAILPQGAGDTMLSDPGIAAHRLDGAALLPLSFRLDDPEPFWQAFHELLFEQERPSYTRMKFQLLFHRLVIDLTEALIATHRPGRSSVGRSSVAYAVVTWMAEHLNDPNLSIKTVADAVELNPDYVGRRFKEVMGLSVGDYLLKKRLERAVKLLQETHDGVAGVAEACGFSSLRNFLRQFKAQLGLTPSEVRKRHTIMHVNSL